MKGEETWIQLKKMAAHEREREENGKNNEEVFWGDLERRRPTKRQTTIRHFGIVKNWVEHNGASELKESSRKNSPSLQSKHVSSRTGSLNGSPSSSRQSGSHKPLSSQQLYSIVTDNELGTSPQQAPVVCQSSLEVSLPGAAEVTPLKIFRKKSDESSETHKDSEENDEDDDEVVMIEKHTPERNMASPQTGLQSGPTKRKVVAFHIDEKEDNDDNVGEIEYKDQHFVRLFNADRGRKRSVTDVTDLDIILTNVEEIALELRNDGDSPLSKKVIREAFIQLRQIFSDSIDVYKEKKYLKSALTKTNSKMKKMKQELVKQQAKRTRTQTKLEKLQSEYEKMEKQRKGKEEANSFLTEFENLQERLRKTEHKQKEHCPEERLPLFLSEARGYLSTHRQVKDINDKLQNWLDKKKSL